ncbi:penicillin-binding protein [Catellatospora methionotrophica]|uniref:Penicillin-binding protein n=1 Tax=Catellatospora methionotrophica TaxID=121620 RepID=A0A8J3LEQ0_9ACTN|nr:transglycosylase domain-containing protein [Catellatospora methionotrophica]GIG14124.1 penicillin-binding protein [Catellatospora methionotrophica]
MTSYGDPNAGHGYDDEQHRQSYPAPAQSSGRASVPSDDYGYDYSSSDQADYGQYPANSGGYPPQGGGYGSADQQGYGDQGYGQAPVNPPVSPAAGRASVGASAGRATVGGVAGRASVGAPPAGRASVGGVAGRASVRPAGLDMDDQPAGGKAKAGGKPKKKKRNKLTIALASVAVLIMLAGGGLIAFTNFLSGVPKPGEFKLQENTLIFASDGKTQVAQLGTENRRIVDMTVMDKKIKDTLIAGEDQDFYNHDGIDLWGIARAAWNNLTGGATQGASTITQQYARAAADDLEVTYARKLREAVWARELEQDHSKDEILGFYVNTAYFGRGATGVGAAAKAYFGVEAEKLTMEQAAVLGAVLKQPEPMGSAKGYDPQNDEAAAKDRWNYVLNSVVKMNTGVTQAEVDAVKAKGYPKVLTFTPGGKNNATWGIKGSSTGPVVNYIRKEMETPAVQKALEAIGVKDWKNGGLKITLTINAKAQAELEKRMYREYTVQEICKDTKTKKQILFTLAEDGKTRIGKDGKPLSTDPKKVACRSEVTKVTDKTTSLLNKYPKNVTAAAVSIDPQTGGVLAYYGGMDGTTYDKAGKNGEGGPYVSGGHSPASSFKIYTLAAAVKAGISVDSHWDPTPFKPYKGGSEIRNAGRDGNDAGCDKNCSLAVMAQKSFNVPFYKVTEKITPGKVVDMAAKAGVTMMWDNNDKGHDLTKGDPSKLGPNPFFNHVGFGQYPITVLDHASGISTFAANGIYRAPHFIAKVERKVTEDGKTVWKPVPGTGPNTKGVERIEPRIVGEVNAVLKNYSGTKLSGRDSVSKSGTWQASDNFAGENSSAWYVGYTPQIATAVWVGNYLHESEPIRDPGGNKIGSGNLPKTIWTQFMNKADDVMGFKPKPIEVGCGGCIGDPDVGDGKETTPTPDPNACAANPQAPGCENQPNPGDPGNPGNNPNPTPTPSGTRGNGICIPKPGKPCP